MTERQPIDPTVTHTPASLNAESGWSTMAKIIRDVDEEKIRDQKEDIDTFLTFAGLYSAVLTAFLIESYQNLRQDPADVMVFLLQQVVAQTQSYSLHAGFLNSTAAPSSLPAFQPSVNAVRVNILWFASLVLSLVSASFGILVKQWLREYLAGEYTSPQARLRIRHFRNPGLATWKVFEIAAVLPMLLQLSLALFFVGLCYFSAGVHSSIGHTTLPLVAGWAFLFVAASLAPTASPRCPYKTPMLKSVTSALRKLMYKGGLYASEWVNRVQGAGSQASVSELYHSLVCDEEHAAKTEKDDVDILIKVDAIQSDAQLLRVMWGALRQTQPDPADAVTFLYRIVGERLQRNICQDSNSRILDLNSLPKATCTTIMAMAAEVLGQEVDRQVAKIFDWSPWMLKSLDILLAETSAPLPDSASGVFASCLSDERHVVFLEILKARCRDPSAFLRVFLKLQGSFRRMSQESNALMDFVRGVLQHLFCNSHNTDVTHPELADIIQDHTEIGPEHVQYLYDLFLDRLAVHLNAPGSWAWSMSLELEFLISIYFRLDTAAQNALVKFARDMLLNGGVWAYFGLAMGKPKIEVRSIAQELFLKALLLCSTEERLTIFQYLDEKASTLWRDKLETEGDQMDPLQTCYMQLRIFKTFRDNGEVTDDHWPYLRNFWSFAIDGLAAVRDRIDGDSIDGDGYAALARECLALIDELEPYPTYSSDELALSGRADSLELQRAAVTDELIAGIIQFVPYDVRTHRIACYGFSNSDTTNTP